MAEKKTPAKTAPKAAAKPAAVAQKEEIVKETF